MSLLIDQVGVQLDRIFYEYIIKHDLTRSEILLLKKLKSNILNVNWNSNYGFNELTESERALLEDVKKSIDNVKLEVKVK